MALVVYWAPWGEELPARGGRAPARSGDSAAYAPETRRPPEPQQALPRPHVGDQTIQGRVLDIHGKPLPGVQINYYYVGIPWIDIDTAASSVWEDGGRSDDDGAFVLRHLDPLLWSICARKPGYATKWVRAASGDAQVEIRLHRAATLSGTVVTADGNPAKNAWVNHTLTVVDGWFRLDVGPGPTRLDAQATVNAPVPGGTAEVTARGHVELTVQEGEVRDGLRIVLNPPVYSVLPLRVLLPDGSPFLEDIDLDASRANFLQPADERGRRLAVAGEPPGTEVHVTFSEAAEALFPGHEQALRTLPPETREEVIVHLPPPARVTVRVHPSAAPGLSVDVLYGLRVLDNEAISGPFVFLVPPGRSNRYSVDADGYVSQYHDGWVPAGSEEIEIRLEPEAVVCGRVLMSNGAPAQGSINKLVELDAQGRFEWRDAPGRTTLVVWKRLAGNILRMPVAEREVVLRAGRPTQIRDIVLPEIVPFTGTVRDEVGRPAGGAQVMLLNKQLGMQGFTLTPADGEFEMGVPAGARLRVVVWKEGAGTAISPAVTAPVPEPLALQLTPEASLRVRPRNDDWYSLQVETLDEFELYVPRRAQSWDETGARWDLTVPPGPLIVRLLNEAGTPVFEETITATPGMTTEVPTR